MSHSTLSGSPKKGRPKPPDADQLQAVNDQFNAIVKKGEEQLPHLVAAAKVRDKSRTIKASGKAVQVRSVALDRPKVSKDFPLFAGACGRWRKKFKGIVYYFGRWADDFQGARAIKLWNEQKDEILAGNPPKPRDDGVTLLDLANRFLTEQDERVGTGEIKHRTFRDYRDCCERLLKAAGKYARPSQMTRNDFAELRKKLLQGRSVGTLIGEITRIKILFNWGVEAGLLTKLPDYGKCFKNPTAKEMRRVRNERGPRMLQRHELWKLLYGDNVDGKRVAGASQPLRAMILLGVNCGLGNADVGQLPISSVDLRSGWLDFPRPKTEVARRAKLWPETVEAIESWLVIRPHGADSETDELLFVTSRGNCWYKDETDDRPITKECAKILRRLKLNKYGRGFYDLRRTFRTVASGSGDERAASSIMGHVDSRDDMGAVYIQEISDERLERVSEFVRSWLWPIVEGGAR